MKIVKDYYDIGCISDDEDDYDIRYISDDGYSFCDEESCRNHEKLKEIKNRVDEISPRLKRMTDDKEIYLNEFDDNADQDIKVEIFNIETEDDLKLLKEYVLLEAQINYGETCKSIVSEIKQSIKTEFTDVTCGHEVIVFWDWRGVWFWLYGDGSIDEYCNCCKKNFLRLIRR